MPGKIAEFVRKRCLEESSIEGTEIKNLAVLTIAFQLVFTGFYALQNLHSSLHDEESLGLVCLSVLYGTGIVSSVMSPTIIGVFGVKSVLVTAFAAHSIYVVANFYPRWATMVPAAIFLGALYGPAWTSQGVYLSACSFSYSKSSSSSPFSVLSRFNGFFFAVIATTQIVGNIMTSLVIRDGVGNKSEVIVFKYCGPNDCPANENATMIEDPEDWVIDLVLFVFLALAVCGLLLTFFVLTPLPRSEWIGRVSPKQMGLSCLHVLGTTNMPFLVPFFIFTGMEHAFLLGSFTKSYISCPIGIHMVGFVMSAYGITTPVFTFMFSKLVRVAGRFILIMASCMLHLVVLIFILHWEPTDDDIAIIFLVPILWGMAESIQQAQTNSLVAMLYPDQKESAFANFHAWRSLGYCVTFLNVAYMCVEVKIIICIVCLVLGSGLYVFVEIQTKVKEKSSLKASAKENQEVEIGGNENDSETGSPSNIASVNCSPIERLSFEHYELADIIKDAEICWRRDANGNMVLEAEKVMSQQHLKDSKVTNLFHTRIPPEAFREDRKTIPRSKSDTHLLTNPYKRGLLVKGAPERKRPASAVVKSGQVPGTGFLSQQQGDVIHEDAECMYDDINEIDVEEDDVDVSFSVEFGSYSPHRRGFYDDDEEVTIVAVDSDRFYVQFSKPTNFSDKSNSDSNVTHDSEVSDNGLIMNGVSDRQVLNDQVQGYDQNWISSASPQTSTTTPTSSASSVEPVENNVIKKMNKRLYKKQLKHRNSSTKGKGHINNGFVPDDGQREITKKIKSQSREKTDEIKKSRKGLLKRRQKNKSLHLRIENRNGVERRRASEGSVVTSQALTNLSRADLEKYKKYTASNLIQSYRTNSGEMDTSSDVDSDGFVDELEEVDEEMVDGDGEMYHLQNSRSLTPGKEDTISIY